MTSKQLTFSEQTHISADWILRADKVLTAEWALNRVKIIRAFIQADRANIGFYEVSVYLGLKDAEVWVSRMCSHYNKGRIAVHRKFSLIKDIKVI